MAEQNPRNTKPYNVSIVVTSDTCSKDESQDASGAYVTAQLRENPELFGRVSKICVPDDHDLIVASINGEIESKDPALLLTIGGTGLCPRDVTPEACESLYEKRCSGVVAALLMASLRYTPHAALSRLTSGIVSETLIINFPGSLKACKDCLPCMMGFIEHALEQIRFNADAYKTTHNKINKPVLVNNFVSNTEFEQRTNSEYSAPMSGRIHKIQPKVNPNQKGPSPKSQQGPRLNPKQALTQTKSVMSSTPDLRSSRLSIKAVLDSRVDPLGSIDNLSICSTQTNLTDLGRNNKSSTKLGIHNRMDTVKPMQNKSKYQQVSHEEALEIMKGLSPELLSVEELVSLSTFQKAYACIGDVLNQDLKPKRLIPPSTASMMDGYILNVPIAFKNLINHTKKLPPVKVVESLEKFKALQADPKASLTFFCCQVNTGGRLPERNYAVIPVEKTSRLTEDHINVYEVKQGCYVRKAGSDLSPNDSLTRGTIIGPVELSLIMAMQHREISIIKRPNLGFLSTGDELISFFDSGVDENSVIDTNAPLLTSLFRSEGYRVKDCGIVKDDPVQLLSALSEGLHANDVLIVTGGASMGSKDHVKDVVESMGGIVHFGRVNIKPGKPASLASLIVGNRRKFIFSLPGNPVSAYVTAMILVKPFLHHAIRYHFHPRPL